MPFTVAHTAAVLPIKKLWPKYFSLTGLMAGAMAPDLIFFLQLTTVSRGVSHSWLGLATFCLPAGIAFSFAFHWLFKYNFIINLPTPLDRALSGLARQAFRVSGWRSWLVLILSVLVGALSHFLWDSFTHAGGEIARMVPFLTGFTTIMGVPVMNAAIAQQISTAVGMAALILGVWKAGLLPQAGPPLAPRPAKDKLAFWVVFGASATFFAALVVAAVEFFYPEHRVNRLAIFGISGWSGFFYSLAVYTVSQRVRRFVVIFIDSR